MHKTKIIIVTGKAQAGKDTTCDYLMDKLMAEGYRCRKYAFAKYLKNICIDLYGLSYEQVYGSNDEKNTLTTILWENLPFDAEVIQHLKVKYSAKSEFMTAREFMQILGTDICRYIDKDCWCRAALNEIEYNKDIDYAFICDARFPNEIDFFLKHQPTIIRLLRNPYDSKHISETALDNYDWGKVFAIIINNIDMTIEEKQSQLDELMEIL